LGVYDGDCSRAWWFVVCFFAVTALVDYGFVVCCGFLCFLVWGRYGLGLWRRFNVYLVALRVLGDVVFVFIGAFFGLFYNSVVGPFFDPFNLNLFYLF